MVIRLRSFLLSVFLCLFAFAFAQSQPNGTRGLYFNGNTFAQVPNHISLNFTSDFTIEAWVKLSRIPSGSTVFSIVSKRGSISGGYEFNVVDGGKLELVLPGTDTYVTAANHLTEINRWYHVAVCFNMLPTVGTRFFVDGTLVQTINGLGAPIPSTSPLRIGANNSVTGGSFFHGQIDALRISNFPRYSTSFTPPLTATADANTVGAYNFDETAGQIITDQSSSGNDGTLGTTTSAESADAIRAIRTVNTNNTGAGSLRQAILDANFDADVNYLDFSIPNSAPWVINVLSNLPAFNKKVIVDGTSQQGWSETSLIEINGTAITATLPDAAGLTLTTGAAESEIYGMEIYGFTAGATAAGIFTELSVNNLIIGAANKRNVLRNNTTGLYVNGDISGSVIANNYIGLDKTGSTAQPNTNGIWVVPAVGTANNVQIEDNVIAANTNNNIRIAGISNNLVIRNNRIGTNAAGTSAAFTQAIGIFLGGSANNAVIGGAASTEGNIIGGHSGRGIQLLAGDNHVVKGNRIGTDLSGTANLGNAIGIEITLSSVGNIIGSAGEENTIAFNGVGISILGTASAAGININNRISRNLFYCNTSAAISLESPANNNKAAPVITTATLTSVSGTAAPNDIIEIFRDNTAVCGAPNQGRFYVATVTADAGGNWSYAGSFPAGSRITATATDAADNTSPFSTAFALPAPYTTRGNAIWNANGNWSLDDGATDCSCNPAGQANVAVVIRHVATVLNSADIGINNIVELQSGGELFLQAAPVNQIAEIRTSGTISTATNVRFGYVPVSNAVVALNNLDHTDPQVAVIFEGGDGNIPVRLGTEATPKPYPSVMIASGNKTMQFPAGASNYFINGALFIAGGATLNFNAAAAGNTLTVDGSLITVAAGATLNANNPDARLIINYTLRNLGGTINGTTTGLEFANLPTAVYQHETDGGSIPTATWGAQSLCSITGASNIMPGGWAGQTFGNLFWDCGNQQTFMAFNADFEVAGTFVVNQTRNPSFPVALSVASTGNYTLKVNNFEMSAPINQANFYPYGGTNPSHTGTLEIKGDAIITGGGIGVTSGIGTSRLLFTGAANSNLIFSPPSFSFNGDARWVLEIDKSAGATVNASSSSSVIAFPIASGTPASFLRLTNGTFNIAPNNQMFVSNIEGSNGTLQMNADSRLYLAQDNPLFINSFTGTVALHPTSRIIYRSANEQRIFIPSSGNYANLTLDGTNHTTPVRKIIDGNITAVSLDIKDNADLYFANYANATVLVTGNLTNSSGTSNITHNLMGYNHLLELKGAINELDNFLAIGTSGISKVIYSRTGNQQVFGSPNYVDIKIEGGGIKSLQAAATVNGTLFLSNGILQINNHNLTLANPNTSLQLSGSFANSWVHTNGTGNLIRQWGSTNVVFPVGDAAAARPVTISTTATGSTEVRFTNTISPTFATSRIAAGMWVIASSVTNNTTLTFENPGGTADGTSEVHRFNGSAWVALPTATPPPYTTVNAEILDNTARQFTVASIGCTVPVISLVQDESPFLCSESAGRVTIRLQPASMTTGGTYDIDLNSDNVWEQLNVLPIATNILLLDNLPAGTIISNPRVRLSGTSCISAPAPVNLTIGGKKPLIRSTSLTRPTSCTKPDGKLLLQIGNGIVNGLYHVDLNNDGIHEFTNLPLQNDSTLLVTGIAEKTPLPSVVVTYAPSNCRSAAWVLNSTMPEALRPAADLPVTADNEADPNEIIAIRVQNIQAGISYRLMSDSLQIGPAQSGAAGTTLTFHTSPLVRNSVFRIFAKGIDSGCEIALEQTVSIRVYHEVLDSLALVALYNSANGADWQPTWDLQTPVRTWQGVRIRRGRVVALTLNGRGLKGTISPVLQLPRLSELNIADNQLEFDAFENVLPALGNRGVARVFAPQAPLNEEQTFTAFETQTVTLLTQAKGTRNTYQWFKNGQPLNGATGATLTLRNLDIRDAGTYHCEVRNPDAPGLVLLRRRITLNVLQYMRSQTDSLVLVELYRALGGENWIQRFDFRNPVATWHGIQTAGGRVIGISLPDNNLTGEIPDIFLNLRGLGILDELEYLNLSHNKISGKIPESLTNHRKLAYLDLSFNELSGEIPAYIGNFPALRILLLSGNRFTRLPREIGQLSRLTYLLLEKNLLETLPDAIGQLRNLQVLRVNGNLLQNVPQSIEGTFGSLKVLGLADNRLEHLPDAFERLPEGLEQLLLHNNRLRGVPLSIAALPRLQLLTLYGNRMDFSIIEPLMERLRRGTQVLYAPQAPIGTAAELVVEQGKPFTLTIQTGGTANRYRWFKDDNPLGNEMNTAEWQVARAQADDMGRYWVQVTNPNAPELTLISLATQVQVTCGASVSFTVTAQGNTELCGNEPFTTVLQITGMENAAEIRWLRNGSLLTGIQGRNFTPQTSGIYRAMVRTEGQNCFTLSTNQIEIRTVENISLTLTTTQGGKLSVQVAGNPSVQRYEWFRNGQLIGTTSNREFIAEQSGSYSVSLITTSGCRFTSPAVAVDNTVVGIEAEWPAVIPLRLYPNPTRERLVLQSTVSQIEECRMYNTLGQPLPVSVIVQTAEQWQFEVSNFLKGTYLLRCRTRGGEVWLKWMKE